jgi:hypothetical protein
LRRCRLTPAYADAAGFPAGKLQEASGYSLLRALRHATTPTEVLPLDELFEATGLGPDALKEARRRESANLFHAA